MGKRLTLAVLLLPLFLLLSGFTLIGHRGDPLNYPEETYQSFDSAFNNGADYVELDVHESADGVVVIQHDSTIQRMTGANLAIATTNFAQLQQYHTKNGEPIHSLEDLFIHEQQTNHKFLIETKIVKGEPHPHLEDKIAALIQKYHMENRVMFHSFSAASLKRLQAVLPNVPRILIVGSLKRINFDVLTYVDGINLSSDLVTPQLVTQLHDLGKKVYIWDEMNENRSLWTWLVNLNIDGIVTNYTALGHEFQALKAAAVTTDINDLGANSSTTPLPIYENPYQPTLRHEQLAPETAVMISSMITIAGNTYYQIGDNAFVPATTVNLAPQAGWASLFINQNAVVTGKKFRVPVYADPLHQQDVIAHIANHTRHHITAARYEGNHLYVKIKTGWLNAQDLQLLPDAENMTTWMSQYRSIPAAQKPLVHWALGDTAFDTPLLNASVVGIG
ncbi:glycerophosphodiester phosphodiesterase [Lacticaseibacillus paracasei]|uniref:glycerophosphodiester phosphodiesterase n=1 Tax=Lacticaseibacillus paracasei TaxID=1597 RepID=UPI00189109ED|nr:glycerophosphodiester phosphodiesterase [Lacticaseibacillus paracasei]QPB56306.1 glycerophosphodiester phosphodiesterase [Lacticaseibacillus paracasei]WPQ31373.1 glycerophosphodiester phosphodiesterase [Lacticaseibacillus paracasei]